MCLLLSPFSQPAALLRESKSTANVGMMGAEQPDDRLSGAAQHLLQRVLVFACLCFFASCSPKSSVSNASNAGVGNASTGTAISTAMQPSPTAGYIPDDACASCHAEIYETYQSHGMANSFYPAEDAEQIEDFENNHYYHPASDRHYEMVVQAGAVVQRRYQLDAGGKRIHELEVRADAILGSGNHIRSYLYRTPGGEMFQMPVAWYTKEQRWRMNPGYDRPEHWGFQRKITRECMFCHNAYPAAEAASDDYWQPHIFPENLPHGIGCQRCHGPGKTHVELAAESTASVTAIRQSIVNPSELKSDLRDDVCYQCHLQPSSQILSEMVRIGRSDYSFRPGESLKKYRALLDYEEADKAEERFEINHHPYRMRRSRCFTESSGALSCLTCHDPHRKIPVSAQMAHYREVCLSCHQANQCEIVEELIAGEGATAEGNDSTHNLILDKVDCVECHMPERRTHDVIHATMTDHKIVARPPPADDRLAARAEPPAVHGITPFPYWEEESDPSGEMDLYIAIAGSHAGNDLQLRRLSALLGGAERPALQPLAELASAFRERGAVEEELQVLTRIVQSFPGHVQANLEMGMALAAIGQHQAALVYYQRALDIGPALPETHVGIGMAMLDGGEVQLAAEHFREAIELRPLYPEALLNLGIVLYALEQWSESRQMLLRALAADPSFVEAQAYLDMLPATAN